MSTQNQPSVRKRPPVFRALGDSEPDAMVLANGVKYHREDIMKHDSWAATAVYRDDHGHGIVCKFNRMQPVFLIPMSWFGRWLAGREIGYLRQLGDLQDVPDWVDVRLADGGELPNVSSHVFVEGQPFREASQADDEFFNRLQALIDELHRRDIAYVDLHKRENIIVGEDGRPNLIDFQVSFSLSRRWPGNGWLARRFLAVLKDMDLYHIRKHVARCRPDLLSEEELRVYQEPPTFIRWHRKIAVPLRTVRRALLVRLGIRSGKGMATSEHAPEAAFRPKQ